VPFDLTTSQWGSGTNTKMANMSHCALGFANQRHMCVYGGCDGTQLLDTLYVYNLAQNMWTEPKARKGALPCSRMAMCMTHAMEAVVVVGGEKDGDKDGDKDGEKDGEKEEEKAEVMENNDGGSGGNVEHVYVFGGSSMSEDLNDLYRIVVPRLPSVEEEQKEGGVNEETVTTSNKIPKDAKRKHTTRHIKRKGASSAR
jgi:hypothetical protein